MLGNCCSGSENGEYMKMQLKEHVVEVSVESDARK